MEENLTPEKIRELKSQLIQTKKELEETRQNQQTVIQTNPQDKFIDSLFEKGSSLFMEYLKMSNEANRYELENSLELEKEELRVLDKVDTKEKYFKGILIGTCVIALLLSAMFISKAEIIIPVLSLVIGLLFKTNSFSDLISFRKKKIGNLDEE